MTLSKIAVFVLASAFASASAQAAAQQSPASTSTSSTPAAAAAAPAIEADDPLALIAKANATAAANAKAAEIAPNSHVASREPTAEAVKKAQGFGFHAEMYSGKMFFCKDDATLGTRLPTKKCIDPDNFEDYAMQLQIARDTMRKDSCQGGKATLTQGLCGGVQ